MDINTLRTVITVASFVCFIGDEAARLPFEQDERTV
jgi:cbb3-type cytochrome oxidase subunit 3